MIKEKKNLDILNNDFFNYVNAIRNYLYKHFKNLPNNENNNDIKQQTEYFANLENILKKFGVNLNYFNNKDNIIVNDRFINNFINNLNININQNYKIVDVLLLINQNFIKIDFQNDSNPYYYYLNFKDIPFYKPILTRKIESNNKIPQQQQIIDENKVNNFLRMKFEKVTFKIIKERYLKEKEEYNEKIIGYILKLVYFNIEIIPKKYNNLQNYEIKVTSSYESINNTLLIKLIEEQIKEFGKNILKKMQMKEGENIDFNFIYSLINIIHDYDNIFTTKCPVCKKNAKYSFIQKIFFPPYIKPIYDKYLPFYQMNIDKKSMFIHPQCFP